MTEARSQFFSNISGETPQRPPPSPRSGLVGQLSGCSSPSKATEAPLRSIDPTLSPILAISSMSSEAPAPKPDPAIYTHAYK